MRFLLLLISLSIPWSVHSVHNKFKKFKQFKFDKDKCATDYFCLLPPELSMLSNEKSSIIATVSPMPNLPHEIGIYIKPISKSKWIFILYGEAKLNHEQGIHFSAIDNSDDESEALSHRKDNVIVGCFVEEGTVIIQTVSKQGLTFQLWKAHSSYVQKGMMQCVGVLTSDNGADLAEILNQERSTTRNLRLLYEIKHGGPNKEAVSRTLRQKQSTGGYTDFDFTATKERLTCDFNKLKIPLLAFSRFHQHFEVMTISNLIDCSKYVTAGEKYDVIINTGDSKKAIIAEKITCDKNIVTNEYKFFYHTEAGPPIEITGDAFVACGKRVTCSKLDEFECEKNKDFCSSPTSVCDGDKCKTIKCPHNQWTINVNATIDKYNGEIVCRKESREDESKIGWFTADGELRKVDEGICFMKKGCQTSNPIKTICDANREGCATAIITEKKVSCFKHYDMIYKSKDDGSEIHTDKFVCDSQTETWIGRHAKMAASVFCIYNETKHDLLKANRPLVEDKKDKPMGTMTFIGWAILSFMLLLLSVFFLVFGFSRIVFWRARKVLEARIAKFKNVQGRNETERYRLRNPNDRNELHDMLVSLKDISKLSIDSLCRGFKLDFSIYSPEEREKFLLNCLDQWGYAKAEHIKLTIPCIRKCLELERPGNCCYPPLHEAPVRAAFTLLKVLCGCFSQHGDVEAEQKIKEAIGIKAKNIIYACGLDRLEEEDIDATNLRNHAIEAALFAGHKEYVALFVKMAHKKQRNIGTPLRRYAWAAYVRWGDAEALDRVRAWFDDEVEKLQKGTAAPDDARFGSRLEHYIFALSAGTPGKVETLFSYMTMDPIFTGKHLMAMFRPMLEIFDEHQITARFLFIDRHPFYKEKLPVASADYLQLWKWIVTYIVYYPTNPYWLFRHYSTYQYFNAEEKMILKMPFTIGTTYGTMYMNVYKFKDVIDVVDYELMEKETLKKDERKRDPNAVVEEEPVKNPWADNPNDPRVISMRKEQEKREAEEARRLERKRDAARQKHREEKDKREREEAAADAELAELLRNYGLKTAKEKDPEPKAPREVTAEDEGAVEKTPPSDKSGPVENPAPVETPAPAPDKTQKSEKSEKSQTGGATMTGGKSATGQTMGSGTATGAVKK